MITIYHSSLPFSEVFIPFIRIVYPDLMITGEERIGLKECREGNEVPCH